MFYEYLIDMYNGQWYFVVTKKAQILVMICKIDDWLNYDKEFYKIYARSLTGIICW